MMSWRSINRAIEVLKKGGVVIFPTETAYGIGCRVDDEGAVRRLIRIRKREKEKPFLALVSSMVMAKKYLQELPSEVGDLMKEFWPGPLTIVYFCRKGLVPAEVRAEGETLGVRMPGHQATSDLVKGVGVPILAPSANFAAEPPPFKLDEINSELVKKVDYVLKLPCGGFKKSSTVIDCTKKPWQILRKGAVEIEVEE